MADLVGRSAKRDHLNQLRRLKAASSPQQRDAVCRVRHAFFLLEGQPKAAAAMTAWGTGGGRIERANAGVVHDLASVFAFQADRILDRTAAGEPTHVKVIETSDVADTARVLTAVSVRLHFSIMCVLRARFHYGEL